MSHGITKNDRMAYVGQVPWHGLGEYMGNELIDSSTMYTQTLSWQVETADVLYFTGDPKPENGGNDILKAPEWQVTFRSDTGKALGVVGKDWTGIQNWACFEFMDEVLRQSRLSLSSYETAGSLFGGKEIFVLANLGQWAVKRGNLFNRELDEYTVYLLCSMAHDGSKAWNGLITTERAVCKNTVEFAIQAAINRWKVKHTLNADERIRRASGLAADQIVYQERLKAELEELDTQRFNARQARAWGAAVLADMEELLGCERYEQVIDAMPRVERQRNVPTPQDIVAEQSGQIQDLFLHGKGNKGSTKYDGLNGLVEWLDHQRVRYKRAKDNTTWQQKRFVDTFSGENARIRNRGLRMLKRW